MRVFLALAMAVPLAAQTFSHDIAPLVYKNCASCHRPGESAPFPLLSYDDVRKHARQIAVVTKSRYMPPWLPQPGYGEFQDEHRLTDAEIKLIGDWVAAGMPEGNPAQTPLPPRFTEGWQLGPPDLILKAPQPFALAANGPDVFWNFVFTPDIPATRYVRAIEIRPGDKRLVHHANVIVDRVNSTHNTTGFAGMDLDIKSNVFDPPGHFLFWKPGSAPYTEPDGFAWRLEPGNALVLNAHLQPSGKPETVEPSIGLYFSDTKPTDTKPTQFPVLIQLEHDGALNIPAGTHDFPISDDFRLPMDVDVLAVYPHAHYLGKLLEAYATLPDGKRQWLIRIPEWDLNRQAVYRYRQPLFLPKGTLISMRYHYDNSAANARNPNHPPRRVKAGNNATDEMGHLWLQVLPRGPNDRRRELEEALMQHRVEKYPDDYVSYLDLGELKLSRLDTQGAVSAFEMAVKVDPKQSQGHNELGAALTRMGRAREAMNQFEQALRIDDTNVNARYNLVFALVKAGKLAEAEAQLQKVIAAFPKDAGLHNLRGELLVQEGKKAEAIAQFGEALALDPKLDAARSNRQLLTTH